ncbi:restriction endonuclease [Streptacidiphilus sp. N1-10]|uniref:Restriction endonuclease n=1 Tax=Streptacidiphilus jeojiensis TaxID=3229225 RepID=A0ABV6XXZ0_9ACTN
MDVDPRFELVGVHDDARADRQRLGIQHGGTVNRNWRRRLRVRPPRSAPEWVAALVIAAAGVSLLWQAVAATAAYALPLAVGLALATAAAGAGVVVRRRLLLDRQRQRLGRLRLTLARVDAMDDRQFEFALRDLLIRDGLAARQVGRKGDQGADVIADDRRWGRIVVQAKHTTTGRNVGAQVMYVAKGTTGPAHHGHVSVVVTNGGITSGARAWADKHGIYHVDRDALRLWAEHGVSLPDLLHLPTRAGRRRRLRTAA